MLTASTIKSAIENGDIVIDKFSEYRLNPNSYNVTLNPKMLKYKRFIDTVLDSRTDNPTVEVTIPEKGYILMPGTLYLASINERIHSDKYIPCIDGRSSIGRLGISVHSTAGFGDVGFNGCFTLEISCIQPVRIYPNLEIAQVYFYKPDGDISMLYSGRYQNTTEATKSLLFKTENV